VFIRGHYAYSALLERRRRKISTPKTATNPIDTKRSVKVSTAILLS
jgi:hypothetical protein